MEVFRGKLDISVLATAAEMAFFSVYCDLRKKSPVKFSKCLLVVLCTESERSRPVSETLLCTLSNSLLASLQYAL